MIETFKNSKKAKLTLATVCVLICVLLVLGFAKPKTVIVITNDSISETSVSYETTARNVEKFLNDHDIEYVDGQDKMDVLLEDSIEEGMTINIQKAFTVKVTADGETVEKTTLPITVKEFLKNSGIKVNSGDIVSHKMSYTLKKGDKIVIKRVTRKCIEENEVDEYETICQSSSSMQIGKVEVTQEGANGEVKNSYVVKYVDGKEVNRDLVNTETVKERKDKIITYGTSIRFEKPDGLNYRKKITDVRAVSYYFPGNPRGSYGLPCKYGTVAVDPDVIPLGSKVYIEGYGYAIANDTGSSIKGNVVDVYMEKYEQCLIWGARSTTVYIL